MNLSVKIPSAVAVALSLVAIAASPAQAGLLPQPKIENSFGNNGFVLSPSGQFLAPRLALDSTDDIYFSDSQNVKKLTANGEPDLSFGRDGSSASVGFGGTSAAAVGKIEPLEGGGVLTALSSFIRTRPQSGMEVRKVGSDGFAESTFGYGGFYGLPAGRNNYSSATATDVDSRGGVFVSGGVSMSSRKRARARLTHLNPDGKIDRGFATAGIFQMRNPASIRRSSGGYVTEFSDVRAMPDGGALVAGVVANRIVVLRLDKRGRLSRHFGGGDGRISVKSGGVCCSNSLNGDSYQSTMKMVFSAKHKFVYLLFDGSRGGNQIVSFDLGGNLRRNFGNRGIASIRHPGRPYFATSTVLLNNGRLLVSGFTETSNSRYHRPTLGLISSKGNLVRNFGVGGFSTGIAPTMGRVTDSRLTNSGDLVLIGDNDRDDRMRGELQVVLMKLGLSRIGD